MFLFGLSYLLYFGYNTGVTQILRPNQLVWTHPTSLYNSSLDTRTQQPLLSAAAIMVLGSLMFPIYCSKWDQHTDKQSNNTLQLLTKPNSASEKAI